LVSRKIELTGEQEGDLGICRPKKAGMRIFFKKPYGEGGGAIFGIFGGVTPKSLILLKFFGFLDWILEPSGVDPPRPLHLVDFIEVFYIQFAARVPAPASIDSPAALLVTTD
jgi:hypothetical protein